MGIARTDLRMLYTQTSQLRVLVEFDHPLSYPLLWSLQVIIVHSLLPMETCGMSPNVLKFIFIFQSPFRVVQLPLHSQNVGRHLTRQLGQHLAFGRVLQGSNEMGCVCPCPITPPTVFHIQPWSQAWGLYSIQVSSIITFTYVTIWELMNTVFLQSVLLLLLLEVQPRHWSGLWWWKRPNAPKRWWTSHGGRFQRTPPV